MPEDIIVILDPDEFFLAPLKLRAADADNSLMPRTGPGYLKMLSKGKQSLLAMRTVAEKAASYKDPKAMAKKYADIVPTHDEQLAKFKTSIKVCKSSVHVYLPNA